MFDVECKLRVAQQLHFPKQYDGYNGLDQSLRRQKIGGGVIRC